MTGNRRCPACRGVGGVMTANGWRKCGCTIGTRETRAMLSKANARPGERRLTVTQMLAQHASGKEGGKRG